MKIASIFIIISFSFSTLLKAQDITNTLGTNGEFKIKDGMTDYLKLSQTTGNLSLSRNLELIGEETDSMATVIKINGKRFVHNFKGVGNYGGNTFIGMNSGNFTMGGSYTSDGSSNTGVGQSTLTSNTTGSGNSAFGDQVLYYNTTGSGNSSFGSSSLVYNTTGYLNSAFGSSSLVVNQFGNHNSAFGYASLAWGETGSYNSAFGSQSLSNVTGNYNTAIGYRAGESINSGNNNIVIGYGASVSGDYDNQIRLGNIEITYASIQIPWSVTSDIRWKENIQSSNLGLNFISKLNPVSYIRKNDDKHRTEYGLIAQELEKVLKDERIENTGMLTITDDGFYELRYNDLFAPMIKAIQELNEKYEHLKVEKNNEIAKLKEANSSLVSEIENLTSLKEQLAEIQFLKMELIKQLNQVKAGTNSIDTELTAVQN